MISKSTLPNCCWSSDTMPPTAWSDCGCFKTQWKLIPTRKINNIFT
jgi:hypothetical protein